MTQLNSTHFASSPLQIHVTLHKRGHDIIYKHSLQSTEFSPTADLVLMQWLRTIQTRSEGNIKSMSVWFFNLLKDVFLVS